MKIATAGGNGFVGTALTEELVKNHHEVYIITRHAQIVYLVLIVDYLQNKLTEYAYLLSTYRQ